MEINEKVFDILSQQKSDYVVMGDLNAKSTNWCATENNTNGNILEW
jgi:endonuclease/exonuclease/phosphatase family metal-dependent hydrolase